MIDFCAYVDKKKKKKKQHGSPCLFSSYSYPVSVLNVSLTPDFI